MEQKTKEIAMAWVAANIIPSIGVGNSVQPYVLKHALQEDTGIYLTREEFVSLLLEMGFKQKRTGSFRIILPEELDKKIKKGAYL